MRKLFTKDFWFYLTAVAFLILVVALVVWDADARAKEHFLDVHNVECDH